MFRLFKKDKNPIKLFEKAIKTNDPLKAVELYSDAIMYEKRKDNPDNKFLSEIYLHRGEIHLNNGVAILSSSDFLQSIELDPSNGVAHNDLGIWYSIEHFNTPNFEKALEHLNKAIELCPDRADFKMNRAVIKIKMGDKETGRKELERLNEDGYLDAKIAIERFCDKN
jgi:tetratricopeptide (TPR) repeat protein